MVVCFLPHRISSFSFHWNDRAVGKCWELLLPSVVMNVSQLITVSPPLHCPTLSRVSEYHLLQTQLLGCDTCRRSHCLVQS